MIYKGLYYYVFLILTFVITEPALAQKKHFYDTPKDLNRFSLEAYMGISSALSNLPKSLNPKSVTFLKPTLNGRYMFNKCFGVQGDFSFEFFKSRELKTAPDYFKAVNLRFTTHFVWNVGRTYHFEKRAPNLSLLVTLGGGPSSLRDARTTWWKSWRNNFADEKINLMLGVSGQYKFNERYVFYTNMNLVTHYHQDCNFNFGPWTLDPKKIQGQIFNVNLGVSYYFGKHKKHVDWYVAPPAIEVPDVKEIPVKVRDTLILAKLDRDADEIPDSMDVCPDVKGFKEFYGCPGPEEIAKCELHEFPVVLFDVSSTVIARSYKPSLDSLANCMKYNQAQKYIIHGYSDNVGDPISIEDISYRRALNLKKELTQRGIDKDRLLAVGEGAIKPVLDSEILKSTGHNRIACLEMISNNVYDIKELSTGNSLQGLFFTVQVGAFDQEPKQLDLAKYGRVLLSKSPDKKTDRYSVGVYHSAEEAMAMLAELKKNGFTDAFVTAYYLGERITNKFAKNIYLERGKEVLEP